MDFITILLLILKIIFIFLLAVLGLIFVVLCIPIGFEVNLIKDDKISGHADILLFFGLIRFMNKIKLPMVKSVLEVLGKEFKINRMEIKEDTIEDAVDEDTNKLEKGKSTEESTEQNKQRYSINIIQRYKKYKNYKNYKYKKEIKKELITLARRIITVTKFKTAKGTYEITLSEPVKYGYMSAIAAVLIPILPKDIKLLTAYGEDHIKFDFCIKGYIIPLVLLIYVLMFLFSKPVFSVVIKLIFRKEGSYGV